MDITSLIKLGIGLIIVLAILLFFLLFLQKSKRKKSYQKSQKRVPSFNSLVAIIKDKQSSTKELQKSLDLIINYYGIVENIDIYRDVFLNICTHPHTETKMILKFDRELSKKNPKYKTEINSAIFEGLELRG
ncbi:MAG: hypothetical protein U9P38_04250 [Campylobacterota bacterium]|nr:hypothetical protein [Campylobacterota bacterium]